MEMLFQVQCDDSFIRFVQQQFGDQNYDDELRTAVRCSSSAPVTLQRRPQRRRAVDGTPRHSNQRGKCMMKHNG